MHVSNYRCDCDRLKKDGTAKLVPLIGRRFLHVVDSLFWHLPFASPKQAHAVRERANPIVTEEEWTEKFERITAEHVENGAREQLHNGWKQWLLALIQRAAREGSPTVAENDESAREMPFPAD